VRGPPARALDAAAAGDGDVGALCRAADAGAAAGIMPAWVADRPAPGARIEAGAPICTVLAAAPSRAAVRKAIAARTAHVFSQLLDGEGSAMFAAAEETSHHAP
jgi:hypothetical protein